MYNFELLIYYLEPLLYTAFTQQFMHPRTWSLSQRIFMIQFYNYSLQKLLFLIMFILYKPSILCSFQWRRCPERWIRWEIPADDREIGLAANKMQPSVEQWTVKTCHKHRKYIIFLWSHNTPSLMSWKLSYRHSYQFCFLRFFVFELAAREEQTNRRAKSEMQHIKMAV